VTTSVRDLTGDALAVADLDEKFALVAELVARWRAGELTTAPPERVRHPDEVGRRDRPELVGQRQLPPRRYGTPEGRVAILHSVAHIEANAVDLALDAVHRFGAPDLADLPEDYVDDWVGVAADEVRHFGWLTTRLADHGAAYGDLPAHEGLWSMARSTAHDLVERMALVPRFLEARGLDAGPPMADALEAAGDGASAAIIRRITAEEHPHVELGDRWFRWACARRGVDPADTFVGLLDARRLRLAPPVDLDARRAVGFDMVELTRLGVMPESARLPLRP
jgi:uncharacterized ferritin-like protein (DUF455 family)